MSIAIASGNASNFSAPASTPSNTGTGEGGAFALLIDLENTNLQPETTPLGLPSEPITIGTQDHAPGPITDMLDGLAMLIERLDAQDGPTPETLEEIETLLAAIETLLGPAPAPIGTGSGIAHETARESVDFVEKLGALAQKLALDTAPSEPAIAARLDALAGALDGLAAGAAAAGKAGKPLDPLLAAPSTGLEDFHDAAEGEPALALSTSAQSGEKRTLAGTEPTASDKRSLAGSSPASAPPTTEAAPDTGAGPASAAATGDSGEPDPLALQSGQGQSPAANITGAPRPETAAYQRPAIHINVPHVAAEISRHVQNGVSRFEIRLNPPELGRIDVRLELDASGNVLARLAVERSETLDLLQRDQRALERALADAGLDSEKTALEFSLQQGSDERSEDEPGWRATAMGEGSEKAAPAPSASGPVPPLQSYARLDAVNLWV